MFEAVKWAGVAYLVYLGVRSIAVRSVTEPEGESSARAAGRVVRARREFLTVAANPKALLLFTAFLPQFVDRSEPVAGQLLALGLVYIALELVAATGWALAGERLRAAGLRGCASVRGAAWTAPSVASSWAWPACSRRRGTETGAIGVPAGLGLRRAH